jgi:predicted phage baseplate assembly protein
VERVTNLEPAQGGSDAETLDALYARIPRSLRHRDRAVTREDYEDLGELASPEVARSHCVPLRDLAIDPLGDQSRPGVTSLIIVPRSSDDRPSPTQELLERVQHHLRDRSAAGAAVRVVGPLYVRVDVRAEVAVESLDGASSVESAVEARLREFLHPLSGGLDGSGWDFGRAPHHSDVLALIEDVSGVDHVRFLEVTEIEDVPLARQTDRFLVYSGKHRVDLAFDEA